MNNKRIVTTVDLIRALLSRPLDSTFEVSEFGIAIRDAETHKCLLFIDDCGEIVINEVRDKKGAFMKTLPGVGPFTSVQTLREALRQFDEGSSWYVYPGRPGVVEGGIGIIADGKYQGFVRESGVYEKP